MGQETSLNCRSSPKPEQHEIQTTQAHAINIIKTRNARLEGQDSDLRSKKSATTTLDNPSIATSNASRTSALPPLQHQNILKVSNTPFQGSERKNGRFCESVGKTLAEIVEGRYNSAMYFPQGQVVVLVESLVYSLRYMQRVGQPHHDFYPTNVYYLGGIFKVAHPLTIQTSAYSLTQQRKRFSFLAPELISQLLSDTPQEDIPEEVLYRADVFAIGMMILEFCTLQPAAECYDEENYQLVDKGNQYNNIVIKERLVKVAKLYSPNIADCIAEMLRYQVQERISVENLALLVFLNAPQEKIEAPAEKRVSQPPPPQPHSHLQQPPQRQYHQNPPHVQQQFLILPPGAQPPQQVLPLGQNSIAIPTPNYAYTRIGPNNQGLLSPTTLTNKLKVIELIHEKPQEEEESQGQMSNLPSNMLPTLSNDPIQERKLIPTPIVQNTAQSNPTLHPSERDTLYQRVEAPKKIEDVPPLNFHKEPARFQTRIEVRQEERIHEAPFRDYSRTAEKVQHLEVKASRPSYVTSNKFLSKTDENGQTLEQRVERILQMSRSIK